MKDIYLDNSATTKADPQVAKAVREMMLNKYGNPSSLHRKGLEVERIIKDAREAVARLVGCHRNEIIFTSGGTEANNIAIRGTAHRLSRKGKHLITTSVEHASVLNTFQALEEEGFKVTYLPVDEEGYVSPLELERSLQEDTVLVSIMQVNNEVGTIQPIDEIGNILEGYPDIIFHVDAVQAAGKFPLCVDDSRIDLLSISAHKFHGPKGIGALYLRKGTRLKPLVTGGDQERGLRSGTENTPGIAGFGVASTLALERMGKGAEQMRKAKNKLIQLVTENIPGARINGPAADTGAPHILNISFPGLKGEVILHALEQRGIYVSTGSACHSRQHNPSHVLAAMGKSKEEVSGAIRLSLSYENTVEEAEETAGQLENIILQLRE